ncbi:MAG: hypothetical protein HY544_04825 [Candidatus Diapherotrites archaeon]|uniref:Uncharacterized protein n=1 Tax=Candidatus Iainarchaeum sp. TaxID=3101447 RepID=A0A8T3YLZ0_9ARCH|nr:hypothetical protein [Candidatus Diapherotrites archaeon]
MGYFGLAVKGLWCGAIFTFIAVFLDSVFPGRLAEMALSDLGVLVILILLVFEMLLGYAEPPK